MAHDIHHMGLYQKSCHWQW